MAARILPTPEQLRALLRYEPESGKLFWLPRAREEFATQRAFTAWNTKYAHSEALAAVNGLGYFHGLIFKRSFRAHRVAWAIAHGVWPKAEIDHVNGVKTDNRLSNLRESTSAGNNRNRKVFSNNTSGFKGVSFHGGVGRWVAYITADRKRIHLGYFDTPAEASEAYRAASERLHGEFARTK